VPSGLAPGLPEDLPSQSDELRCRTPLRVRLPQPAARRARGAGPNALHGSAGKRQGQDAATRCHAESISAAYRRRRDTWRAAGGGGSCPTNVPCHRRARARGDRHSSPTGSGRPPARGLAPPIPVQQRRSTHRTTAPSRGNRRLALDLAAQHCASEVEHTGFEVARDGVGRTENVRTRGEEGASTTRQTPVHGRRGLLRAADQPPASRLAYARPCAVRRYAREESYGLSLVGSTYPASIAALIQPRSFCLKTVR